MASNKYLEKIAEYEKQASAFAAGQAIAKKGTKLFQKDSPFTKLLNKAPKPKSAEIVKMAKRLGLL